jgi:hypothetical protein
MHFADGFLFIIYIKSGRKLLAATLLSLAAIIRVMLAMV